MNVRNLAWVLLAAAPLLPGCKDFWQAPSSSSTGCTTNCTTSSSGDFYILSSAPAPQIVGQAIVSGTLNSISGSPWAVLGTPFSMSMAPGGAFLYVSTSSGVYVYPISNGVLGAAVQVSQDLAALAIAIDTSGKWLIEAQQGNNSVIFGAVPLNTSTGGAIGAEVTATYMVNNAAVQNGEIAISSDDKYIFVALGAGGTIAVPFNSGASSPFGSQASVIPVLRSTGSALSVAVDPSLRLFYVGETQANADKVNGGLRAFDYSTLGPTLTEISGSPMASGGLAPNAILPLSSYVYVANGQGLTASGNITSFSITTSGSSYSLVAGSTMAAGTQPLSLAEDSSKTFILAVSSVGSPYLFSYTFNATTPGKLDVQITSNSVTSPLSIVAAQ